MKVKVICNLTSKQIYMLDKIGWKGSASNGYRQDFDYCLGKAIDEFIKKYYEKENLKDKIIKNISRGYLTINELDRIFNEIRDESK